MILKNWNSPAVNIVQGVCVLTNVVAGLSSLHLHHVKSAVISFVVALGIAAFNVWNGLLTRKIAILEARHQEVLNEIARRHGVTPNEMHLANQKARANLLKVVQAVGAKFANSPLPPPGQETRVLLKAGGGQFLVTPGLVYKYIRNLDDYSYGTCFHFTAPVPYDEYVASALLLLKNDPTIFDRWARQDGFHV
jgi:hypothetical protein